MEKAQIQYICPVKFNQERIIMEFMDVVAARKSVRSYNYKEVEEEKLTKILEAARLAPSWANKQC